MDVELTQVIAANRRRAHEAGSFWIRSIELWSDTVVVHWADTRPVEALAELGTRVWSLGDDLGTSYTAHDGGAGGGGTLTALVFGDAHSHQRCRATRGNCTCIPTRVSPVARSTSR